MSSSKPNYRCDSGYGERFRNLNVEDSGGGELDNVVAGAQYLIDRGPRRSSAHRPSAVASHGGTMVAYAITKHPALFKVALELFGVTDRASYNERTNRNAAIRWMRKMGGTPFQKPNVYRKANIPAGRSEDHSTGARHARRRRSSSAAVRVDAVRRGVEEGREGPRLRDLPERRSRILPA